MQLLTEVEEVPLYYLTEHFEMGRTAVSKHLTILKEAGLVTSRKVGRETRYRLNATPLKEIQDWVTFYEKLWQERLVRLQKVLEEEKMNADVKLEFQYDAGINEVWRALTDADMIEKWMYKSDFKPIVGHTFQFQGEPNEYWDGKIDAEVLEVSEPHKLSYTMGSFGETTTVVWTLKEQDGGTNVTLEQGGFSDETKAYPGALAGAKSSWTEFGGKLKEFLA